jgi:cell wall-associated NlpC family hydrolase
MTTLTELSKDWIGTPWLHNQSTKKLGCDCVGFLIGLGKEAGVISPDFKVENYHRIPRFNQIIKTLDSISSLERIPDIEDYQPEDILVIKYLSISCHLILYLGNDEIIHCDDMYGVHITTMNFFKDKISAIYRVRT